MSAVELDRIAADVLARLKAADEVIDAGLAMLGPNPERALTLDDMKINLAGLRKLHAAGSDFIAAGAALRRWAEKMTVTVQAAIAKAEGKAP